jgi:hypothetical protein
MKRKTQRPRGQGTLYKRGNRGPYIGRWYDHEGRRRERSTRTTDRAAAERILARHIADTALRRDGVIDTRADVYAAAERRPLAEHLDDWANALTAKGVTTKQIAGLKSRVTAMAGATKANRLSDITASDFQAALGRLREGDKPRSIQTVQHYLRAMKQFTRWLHADGRLRDDPLAHLAGFNPATDRRRERRPLDTGELHWLITTTESAPMWRKLGGADRAMLYRVAVGTGFRASELRSLTPASFAWTMTRRECCSKRDHRSIGATICNRSAPTLLSCSASGWPDAMPKNRSGRGAGMKRRQRCYVAI